MARCVGLNNALMEAPMTIRFAARTVLMLIAAALIFTGAAEAASKAKIDRRTDRALSEFRDDIGGADAVLARAAGVLVFPSVKKAGIGIGGEYGQGALRIGGKTVAYYSTAAASSLYRFSTRRPVAPADHRFSGSGSA